MIKSRFVKENDIIQEKPKKFKKLNTEQETTHIKLFDIIFCVPTENIKEFFLNKEKTFITCQIEKERFQNNYKYLIERYYYTVDEMQLLISLDYDTVLDRIRTFFESNDFEIILNENEDVILNTVIENTNFKEKSIFQNK